MQDNNDKQPQQQSGEQNPTLNDPGAKVTDYGNTTGGSSSDMGQKDRKNDNRRQEDTDIPLGNDETIGNP